MREKDGWIDRESEREERERESERGGHNQCTVTKGIDINAFKQRVDFHWMIEKQQLK